MIIDLSIAFGVAAMTCAFLKILESNSLIAALLRWLEESK